MVGIGKHEVRCTILTLPYLAHLCAAFLADVYRNLSAIMYIKGEHFLTHAMPSQR